MNNQRSLYVIVFKAILLCACTGGYSGEKHDLKGYEVLSTGNGGQLARWTDQTGHLLSSGTAINEIRTGAWMTYHPNSNQIASITNYLHGKKNGIYLRLNDRGQTEELIEYKNDVLHGLSVKYRFGKPIEELSYAEGILEGPFAVYNNQYKLQKKGYFKKGKQDGLLQFFNENGDITMEFTYKDGEKISGGIIDSTTPPNQ